MNLFKKKKIYFADTQDAFEKQLDQWLADNKFPVNQEYRSLAATMIMHNPANMNYFNPDLAAMIRRQKASEFSFYVLNPQRKPLNEEKETTEPQSAAEGLVSETKG